MTTLKFRSAMICVLPLITMHVRAMEDSANSNDMYSMVTRGVGALWTGLDKGIRGHAPRFEEQLLSNTLSTNSKTNSHELDWALDQLIAAKGSGALLQPDRIVNMLEAVQQKVEKNPKILQVSKDAKNQSLAYLERYEKAMYEQLARVATLKAFLEGKKKKTKKTAPAPSSSSSSVSASPLTSDEDDNEGDDAEILPTGSIPTDALSSSPSNSVPIATLLSATAATNAASAASGKDSDAAKKKKK